MNKGVAFVMALANVACVVVKDIIRCFRHGRYIVSTVNEYQGL